MWISFIGRSASNGSTLVTRTSFNRGKNYVKGDKSLIEP